MLAFTGGLLGLYSGFSILSVVEIYYFFFIQNKCQRQASTMVYPLNATQKRVNPILEYLGGFFGESSIQMFTYIAKERRAVEKQEL